MKTDTMKAREKRLLRPILNSFRDTKDATPIQQNYTAMEKAQAENKKRSGTRPHGARGRSHHDGGSGSSSSSSSIWGLPPTHALRSSLLKVKTVGLGSPGLSLSTRGYTRRGPRGRRRHLARIYIPHGLEHNTWLAKERAAPGTTERAAEL